MSKAVRDKKLIRREVRKATTTLGQQMMKNTLGLPLAKRIRIALIIIFKREM